MLSTSLLKVWQLGDEKTSGETLHREKMERKTERIILLGEDSSDETWERVMEAEADLYLVKPFGY